MPAPTQTVQIRSSIGNAPSAAFASAVNAGALLVVLVSFYSTNSDGSITVSDSRGNTWTTNESQANGTNRVAIAFAENAAAGATTITVSSSGTGDQYVTAIAAEFPSMVSAGAFDVDIGATGSGTALNTGTTGTPSQADNLVVYVGGCSVDSSIPASPASGYTALDINQSSVTYQPISSGWKDITSAAGQSAALTLAVGDTWAAAAAVFKKSTAPPLVTLASIDYTQHPKPIIRERAQGVQ